jgi:biotin carboxyl carrier protein
MAALKPPKPPKPPRSAAPARRPTPVVPAEPMAAAMPDPRGVRVSLAPASAAIGLDPIILEPPAIPLVPAPHVAGRGLLGGVATPRGDLAVGAPAGVDEVLVDGRPVQAALRHLDPERAILEVGPAPAAGERVLLLPAGPTRDGAALRREVIVGGWRIEVEVESASRAALRERARRGREEASHSGPTEVRAIIPGVVVSVSVAPGDQVVAGQQLLAVEAMKMQNELRAPRDGTIDRVAVAPGRTIDVGDLLLVIS